MEFLAPLKTHNEHTLREAYQKLWYSSSNNNKKTTSFLLLLLLVSYRFLDKCQMMGFAGLNLPQSLCNSCTEWREKPIVFMWICECIVLCCAVLWLPRSQVNFMHSIMEFIFSYLYTYFFCLLSFFWFPYLLWIFPRIPYGVFYYNIFVFVYGSRFASTGMRRSF